MPDLDVEANLWSDIDPLRPLRDRWDALAAINRAPAMSFEHVAAWWRHLAPDTAIGRIVTLQAQGELVGVAPFYTVPGRRHARVDCRLPGIELITRLSPLAAPGHERSLAAAASRLLHSSSPRADLIAFEGMPVDSSWPSLLRDSWPGSPRPLLYRYLVHHVPTVSLDATSFEDWLAGKSSNFRSQMRRMRRRFIATGGTARMSTPDTVAADVQALMRLHAGRWSDRGHSTMVEIGDGLEAMLDSLGRAESTSGHFRLWILEVDGQPISAQLFSEMGGAVSYVNGGWDESFAQLKPAMLAILYAIEDAFARGDRCMDLGPGQQEYKLRLSDGDSPIAWTVLIPPGARLPLTLARTLPRIGTASLRNSVKRRLPPKQLDRLRAARTWMHGR